MDGSGTDGCDVSTAGAWAIGFPFGAGKIEHRTPVERSWTKVPGLVTWHSSSGRAKPVGGRPLLPLPLRERDQLLQGAAAAISDGQNEI